MKLTRGLFKRKTLKILFKVITEVVKEHRNEVMEEVNLARDTIDDNEWKEDKEFENRMKNFKIDYCDCKKD